IWVLAPLISEHATPSGGVFYAYFAPRHTRYSVLTVKRNAAFGVNFDMETAQAIAKGRTANKTLIIITTNKPSANSNQAIVELLRPNFLYL
ncbi:MAG: hypothetical protein AB8A37_01115, partial [Prochlorococcus sp.]